MPVLSKYELERQANIERNRMLLQGLGLGDTSAILGVSKPIIPKPSAKTKTKKRKSEAVDSEEQGSSGEKSSEPAKKSVRSTDDAVESTSLRRSSRNAGKKVDYLKVESDRSSRSYTVSTPAKRAMQSEPSVTTMRTQNPKQYGHIPGIAIGTWWEMRMDCSKDAVHAAVVAGITAGPQGAYSVALSGGYDDDVDLGYAFTYTGSGGRDLKGTKQNPKNLRTAPQSSDQTFDNPFNRALKMSSETRKPIRVIRGFKLKSIYAPYEGYRYDGLYVVEKAWMAKGLNDKGYLVCKYAFKRLPGQPPLPVRDESSGEVNDEDDEDAEEDTTVGDGNEDETEATSTTEVDDDANEGGEDKDA
ncbi:hypothetical protein SCHPADRAFT_918368 [Schizopora paradoxa]|uniref:YDG domain-containing protein n=1 Tax=Schizopora paradoxa TaxID=27342 RepID=A0A0H2S7P8_9AGAM|nr:hypothetical protein SCHPADRAFT_918368 [Schizopora paradoxa]